MTTPLARYGSARYGAAIYASANQHGRTGNMTKLLKVLRDFLRNTDDQLVEFTSAIIADLTGNTAFTTPPITMAALQALLTAFTTAQAAMDKGGTAATATKNAAREDLLTALRTLAKYVEDNCNNDLPTLLSSGFKAAAMTHTKSQLDKPVILSLTNGNSGELIVKVAPVLNAASYETRFAVTDATGTLGPWQNGGVGTNSRALHIAGLTPATRYTVQVRAIGGTTGHSDWSDVAVHICM